MGGRLSRSWRVGVLISLPLHGSNTYASLWAQPSSPHHIHLLSAASAPAFHSRSKRLRSHPGRNARPLRIFSRELRRHTRTHSSPHRRTHQGDAFHRDSSFEAARFAPPAPQEAQPWRAISFAICHWRGFAPRGWQTLSFLERLCFDFSVCRQLSGRDRRGSIRS